MGFRVVSSNGGIPWDKEAFRPIESSRSVSPTVDDMERILYYLKEPKLWELWYIPYYGQCRIHIIGRIAEGLYSRTQKVGTWL